jgi:hypothetical protein
MAVIALDALPDFFTYRAYRVDPYLRAAVTLQGMGREAALAALTMAVRDEDRGDNLIVLCRMLFTARPGDEFRGPGIGVLKLFGETESSDWPLEPIELVRGVPFLIYDAPYRTVAGFPEPGSWYLRYCIAECDWSGFRFALKSEGEKAEALRDLLACRKWRTPLADHEVERLSAQIGS